MDLFSGRMGEEMHKQALMRRAARNQKKKVEIPKAEPRPKGRGLTWFRRIREQYEEQQAQRRAAFAAHPTPSENFSMSLSRESNGNETGSKDSGTLSSGSKQRTTNTGTASSQNTPPRPDDVVARPTRNPQDDDLASLTTSSLTLQTQPSMTGSTTTSKAAEAMSLNFMNDKLNDVTLEGREGSQMRAAKYPLGCRNDMLRQVLYDDPAAKVVYMGDYSQLTLRALVEYCHTGSFHQTLSTVSSDCARGLVELSILAQDYEFEDLYEDSVSSGSELMEKNPSLACAVYDTCNYHSDLAVKALETIQEYPDQATVLGSPPGVFHLQRIERMDELLCTLEMEDAETLIHILHQWVVASNNDGNKRMYAQQKVQHIPLEILQTNFLQRECRQSGFFPPQLIDTILNQRRSIKGGILKQSGETNSQATEPVSPLTPTMMQDGSYHSATASPWAVPTQPSPQPYAIYGEGMVDPYSPTSPYQQQHHHHQEEQHGPRTGASPRKGKGRRRKKKKVPPSMMSEAELEQSVAEGEGEYDSDYSFGA
mmetsp:Transcript_8654/g.12652  ORF Transcript_8654/g.12652 Transcript_8654/m.12652 type:complete len:538 (-) Transcript_8654:113-1726(-)|eukprot:CAMPEP_0194029010 /NCGR_PEP_ID=MMETSP0009_2-20130614/2869_1 /TAXON_ID=210454 /ORGANISM="Grammatophora oceanica, Strain CCMP 410" /LENGTH=537 /DNA_ID=CAMNT_0038668575 /DNA_START=346 /DNA_END=1962 /DNA_ORIENTATION=+